MAGSFRDVSLPASTTFAHGIGPSLLDPLRSGGGRMQPDNQTNKSIPAISSAEVPTQVFETFLKALEEAKTQLSLIGRLRALLLSDKTLNEKSVMDAVLSEDPLP